MRVTYDKITKINFLAIYYTFQFFFSLVRLFFYKYLTMKNLEKSFVLIRTNYHTNKKTKIYLHSGLCVWIEIFLLVLR